MSFNLKDVVIVWHTFEPINYGAKANEWINIKDSLTFNANQYTESGMIVKLFGINSNKTATIDFDDINVTLKKPYSITQE